MARILRGVHISAWLRVLKAHMTASKIVSMNTGRFVRESLQHKTRNNPILKSKMIVYKEIKVVK